MLLAFACLIAAFWWLLGGCCYDVAEDGSTNAVRRNRQLRLFDGSTKELPASLVRSSGLVDGSTKELPASLVFESMAGSSTDVFAVVSEVSASCSCHTSG